MPVITQAVQPVTELLRRAAKMRNEVWRSRLYNACRPFYAGKDPNSRDFYLSCFDTLAEASRFFCDTGDAVYTCLIERPGSGFFDDMNIKGRPYYAALAKGRHATELAGEVDRPGDAQDIVMEERSLVYADFAAYPR